MDTDTAPRAEQVVGTTRPKIGFYPGSFDPITRGHIDIVKQALQLFDVVEIGIGWNRKKTRLFELAEAKELIRLALIEEGIADVERVNVDYFNSSLMAHAERVKADAIVRGLRQISDFNDEFVLHGVLERTTPVPVVYLICRQEYLHVSSSTARELAYLGEKLDWLVHPSIALALADKYPAQNNL